MAPVPQLPDLREVEKGAGTETVEVELDHDVGATGDRDRLGVGRFGFQGVSPRTRGEEFQLARPVLR